MTVVVQLPVIVIHECAVSPDSHFPTLTSWNWTTRGQNLRTSMSVSHFSTETS